MAFYDTMSLREMSLLVVITLVCCILATCVVFLECLMMSEFYCQQQATRLRLARMTRNQTTMKRALKRVQDQVQRVQDQVQRVQDQVQRVQDQVQRVQDKVHDLEIQIDDDFPLPILIQHPIESNQNPNLIDANPIVSNCI
jgi:peptidoglycan hydrolase CwlO-like protein